MTRVRVGIVSWNTATLLDQCLSALPAATEGLDVDVVVVDNASGDDSVERATHHEGVTVIANTQNVGYARAMNQALTHGGERHEVLIALNPDTAPPPGGLTTLVRALLADDAIGLVAPRLVHRDGRLQHSVYRFPSPIITALICSLPTALQRGVVGRHWWLEGLVAHDRPCNVEWAIGAVHVIRTTALHHPAPYEEHWFMYVEDMDLCWRLHHDGWGVRFDPSVEVVHHGNAAGAQAWGAQRSERWWAATYDWYRRRRGTAAARRYARTNVAGVRWLIWRTRLQRQLAVKTSEGRLTARVEELRAILPTHTAMVRDPAHAFEAFVRAAPSEP